MEKSWNKFLKEESKKHYAIYLSSYLNSEYKEHVIYPPRDMMFNAFKLCPLDKLKVVIIGQDPYHEENQAMGLSFSVPQGVKLPPSLQNIYKEMEKEYGVKMSQDGDLTYLAKQGVLLLNAYLSVRAGLALSHKREEYEIFLDNVLKYIDSLDQPIVFLLWGTFARSKKKQITNKNRLVLESVHPSPLSANRGGWFGNNHFIKTNEFLVEHNVKPVDWIK